MRNVNVYDERFGSSNKNHLRERLEISNSPQGFTSFISFLKIVSLFLSLTYALDSTRNVLKLNEHKNKCCCGVIIGEPFKASGFPIHPQSGFSAEQKQRPLFINHRHNFLQVRYQVYILTGPLIISCLCVCMDGTGLFIFRIYLSLSYYYQCDKLFPDFTTTIIPHQSQSLN
jgi:hypothetical protein